MSKQTDDGDNKLAFFALTIIMVFAIMGAVGLFNPPAQNCVQPLEVYDARSK